MGIASYAMLCRMRGETVRAAEYEGLARAFAERWMKEAGEEGRTRLTFDRPGTWSQKYNIVWDRILGFGVYPDSLRKSEMAHYRAALNPFGLPLDSRGTGAKLDWSIWTATLTQNRRDFDALLEGVYRFVNESPQRVGMGDWYNTATGDHNFMHSRSVVGGVFIQLLYNRSIWSKWAGRDGVQSGGYAPIPPRPVIRPVAAAGDSAPQTWRFTTSTPNEGWEAPDFDDSAWKTGESGFGTPGTPGAVVKTLWDGRTIWIRRTFDLPADKLDSLALWIHHDDAADVFINGVPAARLRGWTTAYEVRDIMPGARRALRPGPNVVAVACRQDQGGQYIDLGFVAVEPRR